MAGTVDNNPNTVIYYAVEIKRMSEYGVLTGYKSSFFTQSTENTDNKEILVSVSLTQKMYAPSCLEIKLQTTEDLSNFRGRLISLYTYAIDTNGEDKTFNLSKSTKVVSDYYIFNIKKKGGYIILTAYSPDYFLTLDTFCQTFTAKKLVEDIITSSLKNIESENFNNFRTILTGIPAYKAKEIPTNLTEEERKTAESKQEEEKKAHANSINAELVKKINSNVVNFLNEGNESLIPYAVQYNESFYDFMVRMCNRDGEFLFFDNENNLCVGLKSDTASNVDIFNFTDAEIEYVESYQQNDTSDWNYGNYLGKLEFKQQNKEASDEEKNAINAKLDYISNFNNNNSVAPKQNCYVLAPEYLEDAGKDTVRDDFSNYGDYTTVFTGLMNAFGYLAYERNCLDALASLASGMADEYLHYKAWRDERNNEFNATYRGKYLYSTNKIVRNNDEYKTLYNKLNASNVGQVRIVTNTNPNLNLGDVVEEKNSEKEVLGTYLVYEIHKCSKQGDGDNFIEEYELLLIKKFEQKNKEGKIITTGFYPIPMPEVRFRKASAQRAIVVDNFDPSRMGRVRVKYPWQSANDENSTPWIRISSPMASKDAGFVFTPDINDEVLIDYEDGNVERPYVCGAFYNESNKPAVVAQTQFPGLVKSITSKHGHHISFTDNAGSERFLASSSKLAKLITSYGVGEETFKGDVLDRYLGGGFEISDYYGVYSIKGCTHNRSLDISSPFGTVSLNAFQGITINAPLGDVKIVGKNVSIEARNNLTIESGTNIKGYFDVFNKKEWWTKLLSKTADVINSEFLDLSVYRNLLETVLRPVGGTMLIKSNRYMRLEAGDGVTTANKSLNDTTKRLINPGVRRLKKAKEEALKAYNELEEFKRNLSEVVDNYKNIQGRGNYNDVDFFDRDKVKEFDNIVISDKDGLGISRLFSHHIETVRDSLETLYNTKTILAGYQCEKYLTQVNNLWDNMKRNLRFDGQYQEHQIDITKRELVYYYLKDAVEHDTTLNDCMSCVDIRDYSQQTIEENVKPKNNTEESSFLHRLKENAIDNALLMTGAADMYDDKIWCTTDKGAILFSDDKNTFFKIQDDGTLKIGYNHEYRDEFLKLMNNVEN